MQQTTSRIAANIEGAVGAAETLIEALHEYSDLCSEDEATQTKVQAWRNAIEAQRDLVLGSVRSRRRGG